MFVKHAIAFVIFPGGYGTLDELFEALTLVQTGKIVRIPIILVGSEFWQGMVGWLEQKLMVEGCIDQSDRDLVTLVDDTDDALKIILSHRAMVINN